MDKTIVIAIICSVSAVLGGMVVLGMYQNFEDLRMEEFTNAVYELEDNSRLDLKECDKIECRDKILNSFIDDIEKLADDYGQNPNDRDVKKLMIRLHDSLARYWVAVHHPFDPEFELPLLFE